MTAARLVGPNTVTHRAEWFAWHNMHKRCYDVACAAYVDYGARGISVARRWHGPKGFAAFVRDLGRRPTITHSLDRIDVSKNYSPSNCRWATREEQARNTRRTRRVCIRGVTKTFKEWAAHYGLRDSLVHTRINQLGWDVESAFTTPAKAVDQARSRYPEQTALNGAIQRCHNSKHPQYPNYGGRGIRVDPAWRGRGALARFKASLGPHPGPGYSLERIDVDGNYEPGNCCWATRKAQLDNRRVTRWLTFEGETKTYAEWARASGVSEHVIRCRLRRGWPLSRVLTMTSLQKRRRAAVNAATRD